MAGNRDCSPPAGREGECGARRATRTVRVRERGGKVMTRGSEKKRERGGERRFNVVVVAVIERIGEVN